MKIKANKDGSIIVVESEGRKVLIGQTPLGTMATDGTNDSVEFEPIFDPHLNAEFLVREFGEEKAEYIGRCFGIVVAQIQAAMEQIDEYDDDTIEVRGESRDDLYLE